MARIYEGKRTGAGLRIGVIVSRFNDFITEKLLSGCLQTLKAHGVEDNDISVAWVPGAFEIPLAAKKMAQAGEYHALITLGCVIRGATSHYDYVCSQAASGIANVSLETGIPVIFGILTTETIEQAIERAGTKCGNKGNDSAVAAIETANLFNALSEEAIQANSETEFCAAYS